MMGRISGIKKEKIGISISHGNLKNINAAIDRKEFSNVSETINTALAFYFENRNKSLGKEDLMALLVSEEGSEYMKKTIREVLKE
jgi:metal-responsive CopG/Arc/MetJ family transcriptional regulator